MLDESRVRSDAGQLTVLIQLAADSDRKARDELYERVYHELRAVAHRLMRRRQGNELQTSALVHEVVIRFERSDALRYMANRRVFFSVATRAMKQILIDHFRRRQKLVDSRDRNVQALEIAVKSIEEQVGFDFGNLHSALHALEQESPRQHSVVMHRFFGGLSIKATAEMLEVSEGTVERDWRLARTKLFRWMRED